MGRKRKIEMLYKTLKKLKKELKQERRHGRSGEYDKEDCHSRSPSNSTCEHISLYSETSGRDASPHRSKQPNTANEPAQIDNTCVQAVISPLLEDMLPQTLEIPENIDQILGDEGNILQTNGDEIHESLNRRWTAILQNGLVAETKETLRKKYDLPKNCPLLIPPMLNEEIAAAMTESGHKRDKRISDKQATVATAISAIGQVLNSMIMSHQHVKEVEKLSDAARLLCDIYYNDSITRRALILPVLNKDMKELMQITAISEFLFGDKLQDKVTACKAVKKSALEMKRTVPQVPKQPAKHKNNNLNYRGPQRPMPRPTGPKQKMRRPTYPQTTSSNRSKRSPQRRQYHQHRQRTRR